MKTKLLILTFILSLTILICGCKSVKVVDYNSNFKGKWSASKIDTAWYIEINPQSEVFYQMLTGVITERYTGTAKYRNKKLFIGINSFKINKEPSTISPNEFILDGIAYKKTE